MALIIGSERMVPTSSCIICLRETAAGDVCPACEARERRIEMLKLYEQQYNDEEVSRAGFEPGESYIEPWEF